MALKESSNSPLARIKISLFTSTATYVNSGCKATAKLPGMVQGVVVQMIIHTSLSLKEDMSDRLSLRGNLTKIEGEVCSRYSTSASARAVLHRAHQWTGFLLL